MDQAEEQAPVRKKSDEIADLVVEGAIVLLAVTLLACAALLLLRHDGFPPPRSSPEWLLGYLGVGIAAALIVVRMLWLWRPFVKAPDDIPGVVLWLAAGVAVVVALKYPATQDTALVLAGIKMAVLVGTLLAYGALRASHRERLDLLFATGIVLLLAVTWWGLAF